ncbi:carbohydrate ABC transporter permease [Lachnotalea sp. AF33-28]|uniref:carbohydrate ABC transporter permease n=1 Tax=Lachnotalea sp. AF33-28 TaxID=2292046 RepID=UPI000E4DD551|nr:carbohydrate ABC transporter permease [Lachnotalea sp. AF33-28]RHP36396.1 carbohydrate ABC transporter permease [Lachnotalea sp. AF33-28]
MRNRKFNSDTVFNIVHKLFMGLILILFAWPIWFIIISSVSDPYAITNGEVWLIPKGFQLEGFRKIFENKELFVAYRNSIVYTVGGTAINIVLTVCAAFTLSRMDFWPRKFLTVMYIFTMYFGGGMIPYYLQIRDLGLMNSPWVMVIPNAINIFNVLILRSCFMYGIPKELEEAASLDGAGAPQLLMKIYLPLSKATLAVLVLYYAVGHWNDYVSALLFLTDREILPLQSILREILVMSDYMSRGSMNAAAVAEMMRTGGIIKYGVIIISTIPVMIMYPFVQKYFVKGVMVGAVKG